MLRLVMTIKRSHLQVEIEPKWNVKELTVYPDGTTELVEIEPKWNVKSVILAAHGLRRL